MAVDTAIPMDQLAHKGLLDAVMEADKARGAQMIQDGLMLALLVIVLAGLILYRRPILTSILRRIDPR